METVKIVVGLLCLLLSVGHMFVLAFGDRPAYYGSWAILFTIISNNLLEIG